MPGMQRHDVSQQLLYLMRNKPTHELWNSVALLIYRISVFGFSFFFFINLCSVSLGEFRQYGSSFIRMLTMWHLDVHNAVWLSMQLAWQMQCLSFNWQIISLLSHFTEDKKLFNAHRDEDIHEISKCHWLFHVILLAYAFPTTDDYKNITSSRPQSESMFKSHKSHLFISFD